MITLDLTDDKFIENFKAVQELRKIGMFSDGEIQALYDKQKGEDHETNKN